MSENLDENLVAKPADAATSVTVPLAPDMGEGITNNVSDSGERDKASKDHATVPLDGIESIADMAADHAAKLPADFDPAIHAVDRDGRPIIRADGSWAKKRGRKPGQMQSVSANAPFALPRPDAAPAGAVPLMQNGVDESAPVDNSLMARWSANVVFNVGAVLYGAELGEPTKEEKVTLPKAFKNYYDLKGAPNIPPEIGLLIAVGAYAAPRLMHEKMAEKRGGFVNWIKRMFRFNRAKTNENLPDQENAPENGGANSTLPLVKTTGKRSWIS